MAVKNYIYAGLDFIFDKEENPWFIELNGSPHGMRNYDMIHGNLAVAGGISSYMKKQGKNLCAISSRKEKYDKNRENSLWCYKKLKTLIPSLRLCYIEDNSKRRKFLLDNNGELFKPDCIFRYGFKMSAAMDNNISMINPMVMRYIAMDKILSADIVKKGAKNCLVPAHFIVRSDKELRRKIDDNPGIFKDGFVLKHNFESLGFEVRVFPSPDNKAHISKPTILQQRIVPNLIGGEYWDLRVFLINGKFVGAEMRKSSKMVTNVATGSVSLRAPEKFIKRTIKPSEDILRAIENEAERISKSPKLNKNLRRRIPKTETNK